MKECPVCKAGSFDDAEVCFGCLHRFEPGEGMRVAARKPAESGPGSAAVRMPSSVDGERGAALRSGMAAPVGVAGMASAGASGPTLPPAASAPGADASSGSVAHGVPASAASAEVASAAASVAAQAVNQQVMQVPAVAVARPQARMAAAGGVAASPNGAAEPSVSQSISVPAKGAEIVLRIELMDTRASEMPYSPRVDAALQARACSRLRQGSRPGAKLEVKYPSQPAASAIRGEGAARESRSRHARSTSTSAPRHAQPAEREACAVGA